MRNIVQLEEPSWLNIKAFSITHVDFRVIRIMEGRTG